MEANDKYSSCFSLRWSFARAELVYSEHWELRPVFFSLGDGEHAGRDIQLGGEGFVQLGHQQRHVQRLGVLGGVLVEHREEEEVPTTELVLHQVGFQKRVVKAEGVQRNIKSTKIVKY